MEQNTSAKYARSQAHTECQKEIEYLKKRLHELIHGPTINNEISKLKRKNNELEEENEQLKKKLMTCENCEKFKFNAKQDREDSLKKGQRIISLRNENTKLSSELEDMTIIVKEIEKEFDVTKKITEDYSKHVKVLEQERKEINKFIKEKDDYINRLLEIQFQNYGEIRTLKKRNEELENAIKDFNI